MNRADMWRPTKYRITGDSIRASTNPAELAPSSRIIGDLVGEFYSRVIPEWVSGDLADLGCGKAPLYGAYAPLSDSVLLADWEHSFHENPLIDLAVDLNHPLISLASESFDVVILSDVLEHIEEPSGLMHEISRILRPGGRLIMNVPFFYQIHEAPHDYFRYTRYALERLAVRSGLEVRELTELGGWFEVMADLTGKLLSRLGLRPLASVLHLVASAINNTTLGRRFAARSGKGIPLGYGMVAQKPSATSSPKLDGVLPAT